MRELFFGSYFISDLGYAGKPVIDSRTGDLGLQQQPQILQADIGVLITEPGDLLKSFRKLGKADSRIYQLNIVKLLFGSTKCLFDISVVAKISKNYNMRTYNSLFSHS